MAQRTAVAPGHGSRRRFAPPHHEVPAEGRPRRMATEAPEKKSQNNPLQSENLSRQSLSSRAGGAADLQARDSVLTESLIPGRWPWRVADSRSAP
jgi:hypothetical protein